ncbi:MAG: hypothetical protein R2798_11175 [Chitinophagales bacterium]|nr:hypothetical protein [Bacteroidota bacterium]MCB9043231.1 hypothetical protein [Chitinophagales bacterium]
MNLNEQNLVIQSHNGVANNNVRKLVMNTNEELLQKLLTQYELRIKQLEEKLSGLSGSSL